MLILGESHLRVVLIEYQSPHEIAGMLIWVFCAPAGRTRGSSTFTNNRRYARDILIEMAPGESR
jgi:hypothetical protein